MAITHEESRSVTATGPAEVLADRPLTPIKWWALGGVVWIGIIAYSITRWLLGGYARPVPTGGDLPGYMRVGIWSWLGIFIVLIGAAVYFCIYRPWRRDGHLSPDGLLTLAFISLWSQDPTSNYSQLFFLYNQHAPNLGCWQCFVPGWQSTAVYQAEGPIVLGFYAGVVIFAVQLGNGLMNKVKQRWPQLGRRGPILAVFFAAVVFDILTEALWILPGTYVYTSVGKGPGPVLFAGHYFQFSLLVLFFASVWYVSYCCVRYFRNDRGETYFERGLNRVQADGKRHTGLRLLALIGGCNLIFLLSFNLPFNWIAGHWSETPDDIIERTYFTGANCGRESEYACPDGRTPVIVGKENIYLAPDGRVVAPAGFPSQLRNTSPAGADRADAVPAAKQQFTSDAVNHAAAAVMVLVFTLGTFYVWKRN